MKELREEGLKQYEEFRKKYDWPAMAEFEEEFECRIQAPVIANAMSILLDRVGQCVGHIEIIFQPTRMADAIESKFHTDKEKTELFSFYKEALALIHEAHLAAFQDRNKRGEMVRKTYDFYIKKAKPVMQKYLEVHVKGWQKKEKAEDYKTYFG